MTKRRRPGASKKLVEARFWGHAPGSAPPADAAGDGDAEAATASPHAAGAANPPGIRPTPDPGALVRSLGPPPLAVDPAIAERHLTAVYEEAVRAATALAAVNGLLATDDPEP
jgi:hypothetical protein